VLFVVGIGYNLARGRQPECHCFGQASSRPISWSTLVRNLLLAVVAVFIVGFGRNAPGLNLLGWLGALALIERIVGLILVVLVALEGWILWHVLRQQGRWLLRLEALEAQLTSAGTLPQPVPSGNPAPSVIGLPVGTLAPPFALSTFNGETITLEALRALGKPVVLIFSDPGCGPCTALLPEIGRWQREQTTKLVIALISRGTVQANRPKATEYGMTHVLLQQDREVAELYQVYGTPSAVLVRPDGIIGSPLAQGADAIRALVAQTVNLPALRTLPMAQPSHKIDNIAQTPLS
jgi:peroxiredoxin